MKTWFAKPFADRRKAAYSKVIEADLDKFFSPDCTWSTGSSLRLRSCSAPFRR